MQIGILGAGHVGLALGRRLTGAGHRVKLSSARGPQALAPVAQGIGAEAVSATEAAAGDLVLLAVPWPAVPDTLDPLPDWQGRILVDVTNPFVTVNPLELADLQGRSASVIVAEHASGARVVKAFNTITMANFEKGPRQGEARRVLFVSGDDLASKQTVQQLITELGYAAIDLGGLDEGGRMQQPGGPLAGRDLLVNQ
ncbi:MAG: 8-hydroxy-5-deazaflavin:NADPH oxidoreductase [Mycobacterium sp.]|jgi:8-hydroxy-5-deazaflavin:NADPH oxidoreductase|nr:8-hydroxy-5-deazaflavin:NADPH oxidoreductase [Mycobacterium sp.]MDT7722460.1 8-hydroxy-5-deazaflavin:NADPH oxidoreductase [Mycobacterium sp.]